MAPLREMKNKHMNMQDVRTELGIKSIDSKIEKRVLERIGHVMRMDDERLVKAATLGWMESLEGQEKVAGKKNKTMLYWRKVIMNVGLDTTEIGSGTKDRKEWKAFVKRRTRDIQEYDESKGNQYSGEPKKRSEKNEAGEDDLTCKICRKYARAKVDLQTTED